MALTNAQAGTIANLYLGYFGRAGDPAVLASWGAKLAAGQVTLDDIAYQFSIQPDAIAFNPILTASSPGAADIAGFITRVYGALFHRLPDTAGMNYWTSRMQSGLSASGAIFDILRGATGGDIATVAANLSMAPGTVPAELTMGSSGMLLSQQELIAKLYIGYFGRAGEPAGLATAYNNILRNNQTMADFAMSLSTQTEAMNRYASLNTPTAGLDPASFVNRVYQTLFNRDAEPEGLAYWVGRLRGGEVPGQFILDVILGAQGGDVTMLNLKKDAAAAYADAVLRYNDPWTLGTDGPDATQVVSMVTSPATLTDAIALADRLVAARVATGITYTLKTSVDLLTGTAKNDTFEGVVTGAFGSLDSLDGAGGTDTLTVSDPVSLSANQLIVVKNIEVANLTSGGAAAIDASAWTGLQTLNVSGFGAAMTVTAPGTANVATQLANAGTFSTSVQGGVNVSVTNTGGKSGSISVGTTTAPTGTVTVSNTGGATSGSLGTISVQGGTVVNISQTQTNPVNTTVTNGSVNVAGTKATTSVTIANAPAATASATKAGVNLQSVNITDVNASSSTLAGTIATISVANATSVSISDTALTTLSLTGVTGNVIIDNSNLTTPTNKTLALTINGQTGGTLDDADIYTTLNVTTTGTNATLANITLGALKDLTIGGTKRLTLKAATGMSALKTVTVTGSAGLTADLSNAPISSVDTSGTTGSSTIMFDATKATYTGGAGVDTAAVTSTKSSKAISLGNGDDSLDIGSVSSMPTAAIDGGAGTDTLLMSAARAAYASSASPDFAGIVTGFEALTLTGSTNQTIDLAVLGVSAKVSTSGGNGLTLTNLIAGGTLALTGIGTAYTIGNWAFASGANDTINVQLIDGSGSGVSFASTGLTMSGVENIAISVTDTQASPTGTFSDSVTLLGNSSKSITASGNAGLTLTATSTGLTSVDASGIALGGFNWTSDALAAASAVKGSAAGANTVDLSKASGAVTYTGGSGNDTVTIANGKNNVVTLGGGTNSFTGSSGNQTITGGAGNDTVIVTTGNNTVNLGAGTNAFTATSGNNTYIGGAGDDTVTIGGGVNAITLGGGTNVLSLTAAPANTGAYSTVLDPIAGDSISFLDLGTETFTTAAVTQVPGSTLQQFLDAVITAGGNASVNGRFGWFQFGGDTYLAESRHDASGFATNFVNGTDFMVKLSGLVDLSTALGAGTNTITLR